jgi:hypothetical protein
MLKLTCRLRDLFESKGYRTSKCHLKRCTKIREVEFAGCGFPEDFRWKTYSDLCNYNYYSCTWIFTRNAVSRWFSDLVPAIDSDAPEARYIRSKCGQPCTRPSTGRVDVWWLSPTHFISWMEFKLDDVCLADFQVDFQGHGGRQFHLYSLSAFENQREIPRSLFPIDFCRHLIAFLPVNYFNTISLRCCRMVSLDCLLYFLSIIPHDSPQSPPHHADEPPLRLELPLGRKIKQEELRSIFSHQLHPAVNLSFYYSDFDESVSLNMFCDLLQEARYLRATELPQRLVRKNNDARFYFEQIRLKSAVLTSFLLKNRFSPVFLYSFSKLHAVTDIQMDFGGNTWTWASDKQQQCMEMRSLISPFFHTESALERLAIRFKENERGYDFDKLSHWRQLTMVATTTQWVPGIVSACTSKELCFFNVSVKVWDTYCNLDCVLSWDQDLFPSLALNYCRKNLTKPVEALSLAMKAVNEGVIYRKTTDHLPCNAKTTNAGVILYLLKARIDLLVS